MQEELLSAWHHRRPLDLPLPSGDTANLQADNLCRPLFVESQNAGISEKTAEPLWKSSRMLNGHMETPQLSGTQAALEV